MTTQQLTRSLLKQQIQDGDRVFVTADRIYAPETADHQQCWPKIKAAVEGSEGRGAMYATLKAIGGSNKNYAAYLIGLKVLRCPSLEARLGITS